MTDKTQSRIEAESMDKESMRYLLDSPLGRWFLCRLLSASGLYPGTEYVSNKADNLLINQGRIELGRFIQRMVIESNPTGMQTLLQMESEYDTKLREFMQLDKEQDYGY